MAAQQAAVREIKDDRRKIRAKYLDAVSALLVDPAYGPAADRYRDVKERAFQGDVEAKRDAETALESLAAKHKIDPRYGRDLQLW